ncbi:MAG: peptidoglycan D,D-transpeptidase FtsI family protein [Alphaproteobacteria bacterium]
MEVLTLKEKCRICYRFLRQIELTEKTHRPLDDAKERLLLVTFAFFFAFCVIGWRLTTAGILVERPMAKHIQREASFPIKMGRADIIDRNGTLLATTLITPSAYANPQEILDPRVATAKICKIIKDLDPQRIYKRLSSKKRFVWLKRHITPHQQKALNDLGILGVYFQKEEKRFYPQGSAAAHVMGFTNTDNKGISGLEKTFDLRLRKEPLKLTIDARVQHHLHNELQKAMVKFKAKGASGIIMDANTGDILSMVSLPDFNPNAPYEQESTTRFNRNISGVYEMGSTFKIFAIAQALDQKTTTLETQYDVRKPLKIAGFKIHDFRHEASFPTVREIFVHSSNIGTAQVALEIGGKKQKAFLKKLGLLDPVKTVLHETSKPIYPRKWKDVHTATISYGHGIAVSPLSLVRAVAAIVNGGKLKTPRFVIDARMQNKSRSIISTETSHKMKRLMRLAVREGTGKKANVKGYMVGGKTGTAEKVIDGKYNKSAQISSFVAAFPIDKPKYVILTMLDEPQGTKKSFGYSTGGWVAAPVVAKVVSKIAPLLGMPPQYQFSPERDQKPSSGTYYEDIDFETF